MVIHEVEEDGVEGLGERPCFTGTRCAPIGLGVHLEDLVAGGLKDALPAPQDGEREDDSALLEPLEGAAQEGSRRWRREHFRARLEELVVWPRSGRLPRQIAGVIEHNWETGGYPGGLPRGGF